MAKRFPVRVGDLRITQEMADQLNKISNGARLPTVIRQVLETGLSLQLKVYEVWYEGWLCGFGETEQEAFDMAEFNTLGVVNHKSLVREAETKEIQWTDEVRRRWVEHGWTSSTR